MNRIEEKAIRLVSILTIAGWSKSEISDSIQFLAELPDWRISELVKNTSNNSSKLISEFSTNNEKFYHSPKNTYSKKDKPQNSGENETIVKILNILGSDLNLSTPEIVDTLTRELQIRYPETSKSIPNLSKKSLYNWFERLLNIFSAGELLHIATILRNEKTHSNRLDWSIRNEKP
jgi:hypothetical protein